MDAQKTVTSKELAQTFGTTTDNLRKNFQRHPEEFTEGEQYIVGENKSYLWTKQGACAHAKRINTFQAGSAYEELFKSAEKPQVSVEFQQAYEKLREDHLKLKQQYDDIVGIMVAQLEVQAMDESTVSREQLDDIEIILNQTRAAIKQLRTEHKSDRELGQALKAMDRKIDKLMAMVARTQEQFDEKDQQFIAQEKFKKIVLSPERLIATSRHSVPLLEAPNE